MVGFGLIGIIVAFIIEWHAFAGFFSLLTIGFAGEMYRKKSYFNFNDNQIIWNFPGFENEKSLQLEGDNYKVTSDWKGIVLKNETSEYSIALYGVWKNDNKQLLHNLQEVYG